MARSGSEFLPLLPRRNARLDSFLKRNTERALYERIRTYEPCVVVSDVINKVYMYAVLSDERVYLAEYPPRALTAAVSFGRVRDIELVNDLPDFLSAKDRERCQHIRITYVPEKPAEKEPDWPQRGKKAGLPPVAPPARRASHCPIKTHNLKGYPADRRWKEEELRPPLKTTRSASCPDPETLGLLRTPHLPHPPHPPHLPHPPQPPSSPGEEGLKTAESRQVTRRISSILTRLLRRERATADEEREVELHLYAVCQTSTLYLHLQSSWNSFIIKSTLLLDPLYRRRSTAPSDSIRLSTLILQTLAIMFRETEVEAARSSLLFAKKGALISRLLLALICDPDGEKHSRGSASDSEQLQALLSEYLDAACSLLFELLLMGFETSRCFQGDNFVSVCWILRVLQPHPNLLPFIRHQARQLVQVLSDQQGSILGPVQSVLLFQRCRLLLACLQHSNQLGQHLQTHFREEFRYFVTPSSTEEKLQPHYPIYGPTLRLVQCIQTLIQRR
ncbi:uncharacterized protein C12orf56 homolog isoform X3 [Fundulus heteroclitus]|uniref:uncharacterized protein C12orf56 homolog isoform X3 n=1 Tax=Fundulus heteroclitus TaxID=8078 RepID=UPI00165C1E48|nr:uncharacterized protein C12orf56 homolog isoform X3 [Fundulus heteroclitus]